MDNIYNTETDFFVKPWNKDKDELSNLYDRDDRFFSIVIKGALGWLTENIVLYNKPIKHFIFNTGSSYLYVETNGYSFKWGEQSGEDQMYMEMPRCICEFSEINVPMEELTSPFVRGSYERKSSNKIQGYNAEMRRLPVELTLHCRYVLSNFNESIILLQELLDKIIFQRYFIVSYLGQKLECSIEFPSSDNININKIAMDSTEVNQKLIEIDLKICTNYPIINERTEIRSNKYISSFSQSIDSYYKNEDDETVIDSESKTTN